MPLYHFINNFINRFNEAKTHLPEYRSALFWVIQDLFIAFPWSLIGLAAFSMGGASLQGFALVAAIKYVSFLERSAEITLAGITFAARSGEVLVLAAFSFFLLLCFSAWLLYMAGTTACRLMSNYQIYLLKRAISLFGTVVPGSATPQNASEALRLISKTVMKDVQKTIMLVRFMSSAMPNIIMLIYAFPILIYIDFSLTLILMCVVSLFLPFFYQANVMAYESDLMNKRSGSGATKTIVSLMEDIKEFQYISPKQIQTIDKAFNRGELKDKVNFLPVYLHSMSRTDLWSNILLGLCISLVIIMQVPAALSGATTWASMIAYLTFLRIGVNSFKGIMAFLTKFSKFYPYIHRYQNFVKSAEYKPDKDTALIIKTAAHGIYMQKAEIKIQESLLMALITGVPLSRYSFPYMVSLGSKADNGIFVSPQECFFIGCKGLPQRDGSLRSMLNLPEGFSVKDLMQAMPEDVYEAVRKHIGTNLDKNIGQEKWDKLCLTYRVELGIVAALLNPAKVVIIDKNTLVQLPEVRLREMLGQLNRYKALTIISYPEDSLKKEALGGWFGEQLCGVTGRTGNLLAVGTPKWIEENQEQVLDLLAKEQVRLKEGMENDDDDYADEDDGP